MRTGQIRKPYIGCDEAEPVWMNWLLSPWKGISSMGGDRLSKKRASVQYSDPVSYTHLTLPTTPYV